MCESSSTSFSVLLICIESFCYVLFLFSFQRIHDLLSSELDLRKCHCYAFGKIVSVNIFKVYTLLSILYQIYILEYNWNILDIKCIFSEPVQSCVMAANFEMIGVPCERQKILTH